MTDCCGQLDDPLNFLSTGRYFCAGMSVSDGDDDDDDDTVVVLAAVAAADDADLPIVGFRMYMCRTSSC
jgi:hypothetical protein